MIISDLKKRAIKHFLLSNKNVLLYGPTGSGKTTIARRIVEELNKNFYYFNLGATQDPLSYLVGTTHLINGETIFHLSPFIYAVRDPNGIILLDELSRMHPEAGNLLISALDPLVRKITLPESTKEKEVEVKATFIATANIGFEYTSARQIDRAIFDRFVAITIDYLSQEEEAMLIKNNYPNLSDTTISMLVTLAAKTRAEVKKNNSKITKALSSRYILLAADMLNNDFTWGETVDIVILPLYSEDGGITSEREYISQLCSMWKKEYRNNQ